MKKTEKVFNVRLRKGDKGFVFDDACYMHRLRRHRGGGGEWVEASRMDRKRLQWALEV